MGFRDIRVFLGSNLLEHGIYWFWGVLEVGWGVTNGWYRCYKSSRMYFHHFSHVHTDSASAWACIAIGLQHCIATVQRISEAEDRYLGFSRKKKAFLFCKRFFRFFVSLESSDCVLSMIFGFLGKFGIGIGDPKNFGRQNVRRKKSENCLVENCLDQQFSIFLSKKIVEKVNENSKFWNFKKISKKNRNFEILNFHWLFHRTFFRGKSKNCGPKFFFRPNVFGFFSMKHFSTKKNRITYFDPKWSQDSENHT